MTIELHQSAYTLCLSAKFSIGGNSFEQVDGQRGGMEALTLNAGDLWTTFNRVQENMMRGGLRGRIAVGKRITTREVTGIDQNIKLNRALWVFAEEMRKLTA